jgi:hypothetical protein
VSVLGSKTFEPARACLSERFARKVYMKFNLNLTVKSNKGVRWMPWHQKTMKGVVNCDNPWGAVSRL